MQQCAAHVAEHRKFRHLAGGAALRQIHPQVMGGHFAGRIAQGRQDRFKACRRVVEHVAPNHGAAEWKQPRGAGCLREPRLERTLTVLRGIVRVGVAIIAGMDQLAAAAQQVRDGWNRWRRGFPRGWQRAMVRRPANPYTTTRWDVSVADVRTVLDRNLMTCILACREVAPEMMARGSGWIVTIGSIAGLGGHRSEVIYGAARAPVHEYIRCLAAQLRPHGVYANVIARARSSPPASSPAARRGKTARCAKAR